MRKCGGRFRHVGAGGGRGSLGPKHTRYHTHVGIPHKWTMPYYRVARGGGAKSTFWQLLETAISAAQRELINTYPYLRLPHTNPWALRTRSAQLSNIFHCAGPFQVSQL